MFNVIIDSFEDDFDSRNNTEQAYIYLKNKGYIEPGKIIPGEEIENALGIKNEESWKFLGPMLELKSRIESENLFTTSRGLTAPALRILDTIEMPDYAQKKLKKFNNQISKTADILLNHDISKLDENSQKKHNFIQRKAAEISLFQQKVLYRKNFV